MIVLQVVVFLLRRSRTLFQRLKRRLRFFRPFSLRSSTNLIRRSAVSTIDFFYLLLIGESYRRGLFSDKELNLFARIISLTLPK
jgi:hypothetical protein